MAKSDAKYLTLAEMAEMAGVSRQAVWNWSRRKDSFPKQASIGPRGPLYLMEEFAPWLEGEGKRVGGLLAEVTKGSLDLLDDPAKAFHNIAAMNPAQKKRIRGELEARALALQGAIAELDPVRQPEHIFDPTNPNYMGRFTATALLIQRRHALSDVEKFYGSGVYALYYNGDFDAYQPLSRTETPIYTGKADPLIGHAASPAAQGDTLSRRIGEHKKSILAVEGTGGIKLEDFEVRYLVTASGFQTTAETFLINYFRPIWNKETKICFGIGKHGDDSDTRRNKKSPWDALHPGRKWAESSEELRKPREIKKDIAEHFETFSPLKSIDFNQLLLG